MTRTFRRYYKFWACDLDRDLWPKCGKNLTLHIIFLPLDIGLSYWAGGFFMTRSFRWYYKFWARDLYSSPRGVRLKCYYAFFLVCCGCDTSYIVSVHIQCQASIYTLSLCRGHSWRVRLAKQETLTPPGHLVSPLVCRGPWMSTVVLYCCCHSDSASVLLYFTYLTVTFDLHSKNFNSAHNCLTIRHRAFILGVSVPYIKTFLVVT